MPQKRQGKEGHMPADTTTGTGRYVTIEEAAIEAGVAERTVWRWIKAGEIDTLRRPRHVRVSLDDVLARSPIPSESPLRSQVKRLQEETDALIQQVTALQRQVNELRNQHNLGEQLVQAITNAQGKGAVADALNQLAQLVESSRSRSSSGGLAAQLAKRGLPSNLLRLNDFAQNHAVPTHVIKKLYEEHKVDLVVYQRPGEPKRNQREWWISQEQCQRLIDYCQQHGIPYTACPQCPHMNAEARADVSS
jgi:excisionase family DNA binding protein